MAKIMYGSQLSNEIKIQVKHNVEKLKGCGIDVGLALMLIGDNPASEQYFFAIIKACKRVGINVYEFKLPVSTSINEILNIIHSINNDERINGLLILFPLPQRIDERRVVNAILPEKDIDGLGAMAVGRLAAEESTFQIFDSEDYNSLIERLRILNITTFLPCTPYGVVRLLEHYGVDIKGKHAVIVGKSLSVGKPLSLMLLSKEATVTVCHKSTVDLESFLKQADIICSATGVKHLINGDMIKEGAVVVDIGINVLDNGQIVGDVDFKSASKKASMITPVPSGVGPVTISMLLENTVRSAQRNETFVCSYL